MLSSDPSQSIRHIASLPRDRPQSAETWACARGPAEKSLTSRRRGANVDLKNSDIFSEFFNAAVESATFPHTVRHLQAEATGIKTRSDSRG